MKINGKWYFNEVLNIAENELYSPNVNFISGGDAWYMMEVSNIINTPSVLYYSNNAPSNGAYNTGTWYDEIYRTIDFGAAYQEVSDEFYTWLTANAVQLSKPIPMTHPKGIKLLTKGHKLSKDLEVVPTFDVAETVDITFEDTDGTSVHVTIVENGIVKTITVNVGLSGKPPVTHKVVKDSIMYADYSYDGSSYEGSILNACNPFVAKATESGTIVLSV